MNKFTRYNSLATTFYFAFYSFSVFVENFIHLLFLKHEGFSNTNIMNNKLVVIALAMLCLAQIAFSKKDENVDDFVANTFMEDLNELSDDELDNFQELLINWMNENLNQKTIEACHSCFQVRFYIDA